MGFLGTVFFVEILTIVLSVVQQTQATIRSQDQTCDYYKGTWVYDPSFHPFYDLKTCPTIEKAFNCERNGRPDHGYLHYRWQPTSCNLPRFNGTLLLEKLRGKRILFVGDSLSLNQWQSLTCMLHAADTYANYIQYRTKEASIFQFPSYNASISISRNALLMDVTQEKNEKVLKLDSVEHNGQQWKGYDVLIFDTWHWWLHTGRKQPWTLIQDGNRIVKYMDRLVAYKKALETWARWVETNVDPDKTQVFFQGVSPDHSSSTEWAEPSEGGSCERQTKPVKGSSYPGGPHPAEVALEAALAKMKTPVHLLKITLLSQLRKDGHPSVYGLGGSRGMDCTHWCLPGIPDTWNELLYAALI